ncbi:putative DNA-binding pseudobarrel domain superfamily [Helianthus anomalus]
MTYGLDRKMDLTIKDSAGQTWDVAIGTEFSQGCPRYNVTGMREFVRDKQLVYGSQFQLIYVNVKVCCFTTERVEVHGIWW